MRVLLFGASGQVGSALQRTMPRDMTLLAPATSMTDVRDAASVAAAFRACAPDVVINCAAFTRVDDAERESGNALALNGHAPGYMARECRAAEIPFVHLSTDYVFDGMRATPYPVDAEAAPLNVYGMTKREGELRALDANPDRTTVVRTAWVHGGITSFVRTAVRMLSGGGCMRVVDDQLGTPTHAVSLASAMWRIVSLPEHRRILHFTDAGVASWYDVAVVVRDTLRSLGRLPAGASVVPIGTDDMPRPARRPRYAVLDKRASWRTLEWSPTDWQAGVARSVSEAAHA